MTITSVAQWSTDQALNTDVAGNDIAEGCSPAGINNAMRNMMAQIAEASEVSFFKLKADVEAKTLGPDIKVVQTSGYSVVGKGGAQYQRVDAEPSHELKIRSVDRYKDDGAIDAANGGWWEIVAPDAGVNWYHGGATGDGVADDTTAIDAVIGWANDKAVLVFAGGSGVKLKSPQGKFWIPDGDLVQSILVDYVTVECDLDSVFLSEAGAIFKIGSIAVTVDMFRIFGKPNIQCPTGSTPSSTCAFVKVLNGIGIFVEDVHTHRWPRVLWVQQADASAYGNRIYVIRPHGTGWAPYSWIDYDNANLGRAAGFYVTDPVCYPYNMAVAASINPVPAAITGATQANPVVVTAPSHTVVTGERVGIHRVTGMTNINGEWTATRIDANTFSLDGVDGSAFPAWVSGGYAADVHPAYAYTACAGVRIVGNLDTCRITKPVFQHWADGILLDVTGAQSYIYIDDAVLDYIGNNGIRIILNGSSLSHFEFKGDWISCCNGAAIALERISAGHSLISPKFHGLRIGFTGTGIIANTATNILYKPDFKDIQILGAGRNSDAAILFDLKGALYPSFDNVVCEDPFAYWGNYGPSGSWAALRADKFIYTATQIIPRITNCVGYGITSNYSFPVPSANGSERYYANNTILGGGIPEYVAVGTSVAGASPHTYTNNSGLPMQVSAWTTGAVTMIKQSYAGGALVNTMDPGVADSRMGPYILGRGQSIEVTYAGAAPTLRWVSIND